MREMMQIDPCCTEAMQEVDQELGTDKFIHFGTEERGNSLVTSYKCKTCGIKWERFADTQEPDEVRWEALP